jgi:hypothetical protein
LIGLTNKVKRFTLSKEVNVPPLFNFSLPRPAMTVFYRRLLVLLNKLKKGFFALSLPQKLYSLAFLLLCFSDNLGWVAVFSVIAMGLEFWPLFERVWHSLGGKAILLLFYAIIANFALATSAALVNEVVGVSASHLDYTHNFALLLYIPAWFVVMTALALLAMQILIPAYFLLSVVLKPLGIKTIRFTQHSQFRKVTAFLRLILAAIVLYHLSLLIDVENAVELTEDVVVNIAVPMTTEQEKQALKALGEQLSPSVTEPVIPLAEEAGAPDSANVFEDNDEITIGLNISDSDKLEKEYDNVRRFYQKLVRDWIAMFAFTLEANSRSRCAKAADSSVVELNDYEILEITADNSAEHGYRFEIKKCVSAAFPLIR